MVIGIINELKNPPDKRVVLSPDKCVELLEQYPELSIKVESSDVRTFLDDEYRSAGIDVVDDISDCDILLGVKEVPIENLIEHKKYFFFSHTIKKQPYNRELLNAILDKNIEMYDHEVLTDTSGNRVVAFGRYAGIVGGYNGIRAHGLKTNLFELPKAEELKNQQELIVKLNSISLSAIKIVLTGKGRVSNGAKEMLDAMSIKEVNVDEYLTKDFNEPVYVQLDVLDYNKRFDGQVLGNKDFYKNPQDYQGDFMRFAAVSDLYISGHYYDDDAPFIFSREDAKSDNFKIKVVADISCDIDGPVACTLKPSTIADPIYGYNPQTEQEQDYTNEETIAVMAVDNLPCELPQDASVGFGDQFAKHVIPAFFNDDESGILKRAQMTANGKLTERFSYLQNYVDGKE